MIGRIIAIVLTASLAMTVLSCASFISHAGSERLIGDIDSDGSITVSDALAELRVACGIDICSEGDIPVYDVSGDGKVDVADALGVLRCSLELCDGFGCDGVVPECVPNDAARSYGVTQEIFNDTVVSAGNTARLARVMERAAKGETINLVMLGGSITYGLYAAKSEQCYANLTYNWWRENFTEADIRYHNVGISGTSSILGVHRLERDVVAKDPDVVIVEFSVNDLQEDYPYYEGVVCNILNKCPDAAVIMFFTVCQSGWTMQKTEIPIGEHYGVPMISGANAVNGLIASNTMKWSDFGADDTHPNTKGHAIYASLLTSYFDAVKAKYAKLSKVVPAVPEPLYGDRYKNAKLYMGGELEADSLGAWKIEGDYQASYLNHLKGAWRTAWRTIDSGKDMTFTATFKELNVLYISWINDTRAGSVTVKIDGSEVATLNSNFVGGWGNHITYETVFKTDKEAEHTITFTCNGGNFTLAGIMLS